MGRAEMIVHRTQIRAQEAAIKHTRGRKLAYAPASWALHTAGVNWAGQASRLSLAQAMQAAALGAGVEGYPSVSWQATVPRTLLQHCMYGGIGLA